MTKPDALHDTFAALTSKQREVLAMVADHRTSKEIAGELGISESAVNQRIEAVRARLGGSSRARLAREFRQFAEQSGAEPGCNLLTWERIQVLAPADHGEMPKAESVPMHTPADTSGDAALHGNGSQLSANFPFNYFSDDGDVRPHSDAANVAAIMLIIMAGMASAFLITKGIGIVG